MSNLQKIIILKEKREKINAISSCFCTAKWLQTTLYLQNGYNHSCHHPSPHKIPLEEVEKDPAALHNSQFKKDQRRKMLEGEKPKECDYCWNIEDLNKDYFSDRHYKTADYWAWDRFEEIASSDPNDNVYPSYLEVSFSNACNLKCSYCSPEISSKWLEEIKQYGPYPISESNQDIEWYKKVGRYPYKHSDENPYIDAFWKWFPEALPHLKVFRITGGEPLMSKDTWKIFEYLKENPQPNLELAINTNLAVDDKLIEKFIIEVNEIKNSVKNIDIYTSLESTGLQAEYSRFGLNYNQWLVNLKKCLDSTPYRISIMTTINVLSLPTFVDFIEMLMQLRSEYNEKFENNRIPLSINYLRWPEHLSIRLLPEEMKLDYKNKILKTIEPWINGYQQGKFARVYLEEWDQIQRLCEYLVKEETMVSKRDNFVKYIKEYDRRRGTDFVRTFPEYADFLEAWNG